MTPVLKFTDVRIFPRGAAAPAPGPSAQPPPEPIARFRETEIEIDAFDSVRTGSLRARLLRITGAALTLTRVAADGTVGSGYELARGLSAFSVPQLARTGESLLVAWPVVADGERGLASALLPAAALD